MNNIKFKGQGIVTKVWLYGYYLYSCNHAYIISKDDKKYEVIPDSVTQYTRSKDRKDIEIYFNDFVKAPSGVIFQVVWDEDTMSIKLRNNDELYNFNVGLYEVVEKVD